MYTKFIIPLLFSFLICQGQHNIISVFPSSNDLYPESDSTILAEYWHLFENNSIDSSGNMIDGLYDGNYDAGIYLQGSYALELEASDIFSFEYFFINDTFDIVFGYYHEDAETESYDARLLERGNTTDGWRLEFDQISGDIEFHKYVSGTDYEARTVNSILTGKHDEWVWIHIQVAGPTVDIFVNNVDRTYDGTTITNDYQIGSLNMGYTVNSTVDCYQFYNFNTTSTQRTFLYNHKNNCLKQ